MKNSDLTQCGSIYTKNYYWNEYGGAGNAQGIFALYSKENTALFQLWGYIPNSKENYYLDGETYGIFHYSEGDTEGTAFMAEEPRHSLIKMIIHKNEEAKTLYVDQDNEMDAFCKKYSQYVSRAILLSQKDVGKDNNLNLKPIYMLPFIMEEL